MVGTFTIWMKFDDLMFVLDLQMHAKNNAICNLLFDSHGKVYPICHRFLNIRIRNVHDLGVDP